MQRRIAKNPSMKRRCAGALAAGTAALTWTALTLTGPVAAQTVPKPPAAKPAEPKGPAADEIFAAGTQAFEQGKTEQAVAALSSAINTGKLAPPQLAKALFYRGVAYRKQSKPGQALSDLTAAVWLRGGLSDTDRAIAEDHRRSLQREVGLPVSPANGPAVAAVAPPAMPAPAVPAAAPMAAAPVPAVSPPATVAPSAPWTVETAPVSAPAGPEIAEPVALPVPSPAVAAAPPAVEPSSAPLPWTVAAETPSAPPVTAPSNAAPPASAAAPFVTVAPVERAALAPLDAAPAPPPKPLPWQTAAAPAEPPAPQPLPWATAAAPSASPPNSSPQSPPTPDPVPVAAVAREATEPVAPLAVTSWPSPAVVSAAPSPAEIPSPPPTAAVVSESPPPAATVSPVTMLSDAGKAASSLFGSLLAGVTTPASEPAPVPASETAPTPSRIETAALPETAPLKPTTAPENSWPAPAVVARTTPADPPPAGTAVAPAAPVVALAPFAAPPGKVATDAAPAAPAEAPRPGNFKLQVAAAQTRAEAEDALQRLVTKHATTLRGVDPQIEDPPSGTASIFGSMGPAYRVSVGPYRTAVEPGRLCNILRPHGFDCKVVTIETPAAN
jgi:hypothetical protein